MPSRLPSVRQIASANVDIVRRLGILAAEAGWRDAYRELGVFAKSDFKNDDPVIIGLYAGYGYLKVSYLLR